ncbi:peptidase M48 Ste24p [Sulfitobacter sp. SK012]|uniref:M48 family metallopeptidase n=1 Tax=Sulfitobacter sp. SK012 TaxID=1389005 RepID=UPI000E0BFB8D|nr:M48 family metallopeptidase [Sulfitobacter sp. SK012]AXI45091.1 peptidase M48 Ste24p [Sulfitobacter sp. SK012]
MTLPPNLPQPVPARPLLTRGAFYFDGDSPIARPVSLEVDEGAGALIIRFLQHEGLEVQWPLEEVRQVEDVAGTQEAVLRWTADPLARLQLGDLGLLAAFPKLKKSAPPKGRRRLALWACAAVAAVALQIGVLVPLLADRLATYIPAEGERALGEATFAQIREALAGSGLEQLATCENPEGVAALNQMVARLSVDIDSAQPIEVFVLDHPMINAFALPGGYVVFFRGLIEAAEGPDEVAAVMAHEFGHVISRDPTRHAMRSAGSIGILGLLFGDFAGGAAVLFLTEKLISAQYSQGAETGADRFAYGMLEDANVSPASLGDMFERMREKHGDSDGVTSHFVSHPTLAKRIDASRKAAREDAQYEPILSEEEWQAFKAICAD